MEGKQDDRSREPQLGVLLEAKAVHTRRSARNHLLALAQTNGINRQRVDAVIDLVGLRDVAGTRVGGFSLGMGQRLGVASALLGNPTTVVLDEPAKAWTRRVRCGCAPCSKTWPPMAIRCSCRLT